MFMTILISILQVSGFQHDNDDDSDHKCLQEGYVSIFTIYIKELFLECISVLIRMIPMQITVTPLGAFCNAEIDCNTYLKEWLPNVAADHSSSSAL